MDHDSIRDLVTVVDENGRESQFEVVALFEMIGKSFALLRNKEGTFLMKAEKRRRAV